MEKTPDAEREPKYLPTWAYLVSFAITAAAVVGVAWAVAWAVVALHG